MTYREYFKENMILEKTSKTLVVVFAIYRHLQIDTTFSFKETHKGGQSKGNHCNFKWSTVVTGMGHMYLLQR